MRARPFKTSIQDTKTPRHGLNVPEKAVDVICRSFRLTQYWVPSKVLSKCLSVPYPRLLIVPTPKDDLSNVIWTSVLVLVYCATHLVDYHESWYEVADASTKWLRQQQHFVDQRKDLVISACTLLKARDPEQLLTTLFALAVESQPLVDDETVLLHQGWQRCFLDEPPYTAYYWNAKTNHSTWRHPLETAQLEHELKEAKERRQALLAKVLPLRLSINRQLTAPTQAQTCSECTACARVWCLACGKRYFCDACCDLVHCDRVKRSHLATGLRFIECFGRSGFPKIVPRPRTPYMIYQDEQRKQQQEQEEENKQTLIESNVVVMQY